MMFNEVTVSLLDAPLDLLVGSGAMEHVCGRQHVVEA